MVLRELNLGLRFLLELGILVALGYWGWTTGSGVVGLALAVGLPLLAATLWAVFRVPGDGGDPVVVVPGVARLALELLLFGAAAGALALAARPGVAAAFAAVVVVHYLVGYDRTLRLARGRPLD